MENKIAKALLQAQMEMGIAVKGNSNPFYKSKYADLNSVREACMPALNKHGIAVLQPTVHIDGKNFVKTVLLHESGEYFDSLTEILFSKPNDPQAQGSGISYARRYGLQSLVNVGADDDDGNKASGKEVEAKAVIPANHKVSALTKETSTEAVSKVNKDFAKELTEMKVEPVQTHTPVLIVEKSEAEKAADFLKKKQFKDNSKKAPVQEQKQVDDSYVGMFAMEAVDRIKTMTLKAEVQSAVKPELDKLKSRFEKGEGVTENDIAYFKEHAQAYFKSLKG